MSAQSAQSNQSKQSPTTAATASARATTSPTAAGWQTTWVPRNGSRIWSARRPGTGPTVVLLHGFPDNHHLYDDVVELLPGADLLVMDFLGFGDSDKPHPYPYSFDNLLGDLDAVLDAHGVEQAVLVPHDISGPPAIRWAIQNPDRLAGLVLLNTYFGSSPTMTAPEIIQVFSLPIGAPAQKALRGIGFARIWFEPVYKLQLRRMIGDRAASRRFLDKLVAPFRTRPSQRHAFTTLIDDMPGAMAAEAAEAPLAASVSAPVVVAFGDQDYSLDTGVAQHLLGLFPNAVDAPVPGSRHFPQLTDPDAVADRIRRVLDPAR